MSKSKHNGVNPEDTFREYGTDTSRLLILADVAPRSHRNWNSNSKCRNILKYYKSAKPLKKFEVVEVLKLRGYSAGQSCENSIEKL